MMRYSIIIYLGVVSALPQPQIFGGMGRGRESNSALPGNSFDGSFGGSKTRSGGNSFDGSFGGSKTRSGGNSVDGGFNGSKTRSGGSSGKKNGGESFTNNGGGGSFGMNTAPKQSKGSRGGNLNLGSLAQAGPNSGVVISKGGKNSGGNRPAKGSNTRGKTSKTQGTDFGSLGSTLSYTNANDDASGDNFGSDSAGESMFPAVQAVPKPARQPKLARPPATRPTTQTASIGSGFSKDDLVCKFENEELVCRAPVGGKGSRSIPAPASAPVAAESEVLSDASMPESHSEPADMSNNSDPSADIVIENGLVLGGGAGARIGKSTKDERGVSLLGRGNGLLGLWKRFRS